MPDIKTKGDTILSDEVFLLLVFADRTSSSMRREYDNRPLFINLREIECLTPGEQAQPGASSSSLF